MQNAPPRPSDARYACRTENRPRSATDASSVPPARGIGTLSVGEAKRHHRTALQQLDTLPTCKMRRHEASARVSGVQSVCKRSHMTLRGRSRRDRHLSGGSGGTNSRVHRGRSSSFRWRLASANELTFSRVGGALPREGLEAHSVPWRRGRRDVL